MKQNMPPRPRYCLTCAATLCALMVAVIGSFWYLSLEVGGLFTAASLRHIAQFVGSFFPADFSHAHTAKIWQGALETLAISALGTLLAVIVGMLLALPASGRAGRIAKSLTRFLLNFLRSVPELVWATLMVLAAGLGPFAGTLALALHTSGVLGRLFAETLENTPTAAAAALADSGAVATTAFFYGTLPQVLPQLLAYSLYRWEMNIRMAAVLGFVGAGGLGQMLYFSLSLFQMPQACTVILAMLFLVAVVDGSSAWLRKLLA